MFKPDVIAADFETTGLRSWESDFRVTSCALSWVGPSGSLKHRFLVGEREIGEQLAIIQRQGIPLVAHNAQFEIMVTMSRFPNVDPGVWQVDTMRLVQNRDSGGRQFGGVGEMSIEDQLAYLEGKAQEPKTGLSLQSSVERFLPAMFHNHKEPFYQWLREHKGVKKGQEGANLYQLPPDMLREYNIADTTVTLLLYQDMVRFFDSIGFDWRIDHALHMSACRRISKATIDGLLVDRDALSKTVDGLKAEMNQIEADFTSSVQDAIATLERRQIEDWVNEPKTECGRTKRRENVDKHPKFNPRSTTQLKALFVDTLGIQPQFWTKETKASQSRRKADPTLPEFQPKPSFRAAHLPSYGKAGEILAALKKRQLVWRQATNLLELAQYDGKWHHHLRACSTKTGRYSGGG